MSEPFEGEIARDAIVARIEAHPLGETPEEMRPRFERLVLGDDPAAPPGDVDVEQTTTGLRVRPAGAAPAARIVWFHGGGYVFGSPETHLRPAAHLARAHGVEVYLPRYRLAPEHSWPAQIDDARAALADEDAPILAGDSAGGHLALVAALDRARAGGRTRALLLFCPNTDRSGLNRRRAEMNGADPMVDDRADRALAALNFGDRDPREPEVSPALDDLSLLPPTHIEVGEAEVLTGDSEALARRAADLGRDVSLHVAPGLLHMGQLWAPWWADGRESLDRAARFALAA